MTENTPFVPNAENRDLYLENAKDQLESAMVWMRKAMRNAENWADLNTLNHYHGRMQDILQEREDAECGMAVTYNL